MRLMLIRICAVTGVCAVMGTVGSLGYSDQQLNASHVAELRRVLKPARRHIPPAKDLCFSPGKALACLESGY